MRRYKVTYRSGFSDYVVRVMATTAKSAENKVRNLRKVDRIFKVEVLGD